MLYLFHAVANRLRTASCSVFGHHFGEDRLFSALCHRCVSTRYTLKSTPLRCLLFGHHRRPDACYCRHCGTFVAGQHDWNGCECLRCTMVRDAPDERYMGFSPMEWVCSPTAVDLHDWDGCVCRRCRARHPSADRHRWAESYAYPRSEPCRTPEQVRAWSALKREILVCTKCGTDHARWEQLETGWDAQHLRP